MKPSRFAGWLTLPFLVGLPFLAGAAGPDLTGHVLAVGDEPVPEASIFIYTAGPRHGQGHL